VTGIDNLLLLGVILLNYFILGSSRLGACIKAVALQGALIAILPVLLHGFSGHALLLTTGALLLKGGAIPWLLFHALKQVRIRREIEPLIGYITTLVLGAATTTAAFIFADMLPLLPAHRGSLFIPTALATLFAGFLVLITRRKAITQVLGYLIFENGIFIFATLLSAAMPLMVEAGVLLDLLVAIFVMAIVIHHINREFATVNTEQLSSLRE
jgi:hydrogenase-4 component E